MALALTLVLTTVASLWSATSWAQTAAAKNPSAGAKVQHVLVRGAGSAMEVEIQTSGAPVEPESQIITGPDRIVVDFPGALPSSDLRALKVNHGALKGVRSGLFFSNPPITRVVLDLSEPQSYQISSTKLSATENSIVIKLKADPANVAAASANANRQNLTEAQSGRKSAPPPRIRNAAMSAAAGVPGIRSTNLIPAASNPVPVQNAAATSPAVDSGSSLPAPSKPDVTVTFENGMLRIRSDRATMAQVLFAVQQQTHAEIAIPSGAEQEEVFADLGPAPARDVLGSLLNGSPYNFIFVGSESNLEQVILTRRDPSIF